MPASPGFGRGAEEFAPAEAEEPAPSEESAVDALFRKVDGPRESPSPAPLPAASTIPALRMARVVSLDGGRAKIAWRGSTENLEANLAPEVAREVIEGACQRGDAVLVEWVPNEPPLIVGVVQTRIPDELDLRARVIRLQADNELLLRSGTGAIRIRSDGDIEVVGSRISASSRGLFRLVGRILRLN